MRTRKYAGGGKIQKQIKDVESLINDPQVPETDKANFRELLEQLKSNLEAEKQKKPSASAEKPIERKPTQQKPSAGKPKPTEKKEEKVPKGIRLLSKKKVVIDGVEMSTDSKQFCDYLTAQFMERQKQAKERKQTKKKTQSVMAQVTDKIERGVEKAIKTGISKQKPSLQKNPQVFIGKVQKLETATKNFLKQLKEVLGNEYDAKEVTDTANAIKKMIDELKKKYVKK